MSLSKIKRRVKLIQDIINGGMCFGYKARYDYLSSFAAHAALFMIMSLFPLAMFLCTFLQYMPIPFQEILEYITNNIPDCISPLLLLIAQEVYEEVPSGMQLVSVFVTIFCASKGFYAILLGMNAIYGIRETRNMVTRYAIAIIYVIVFALMLILTMILVVFGRQIFHLLLPVVPLLFRFTLLINIGRYCTILIFLMIFFLIVFINVPNRKSRIRNELPGAFFAALGWIVFSVAFSYYIDNLANYSVTYGSLATIVIFIVWFYAAMSILFIGAEINVVFGKYKELDKDFQKVLQYYKEAYELEDLVKELNFFDIKRRIEQIENKKDKVVNNGRDEEKKG